MILCEHCEEEFESLEDQFDHFVNGHADQSPEFMIPPTWEFDTADFSVRGRNGHILLRRNKRGQEWWHGLSEEEREKNDLFISGSGMNLKEAISDAVKKINSAVKST